MVATGFLEGRARDRGLMQTVHGKGAHVVEAIGARLEQNRALLGQAAVQDYLKKQWQFASENCAPELAEMVGIARGFSMNSMHLFEFLHLGIIGDHGQSALSEDGCSVGAVAESPDGPLLGKNRDFLGEHAILQSVFSQADPHWKDGRKVLCVGSLGCPGAYSSGMNSDGFAVADTQISTPDHGVGWLRYFLMTRLLAEHSHVATALEFAASVPHAGGGSLVLCDAHGGIGAVDLGHGKTHMCDGSGGFVARTNHFERGSVALGHEPAPMQESSWGRLETLRTALSRACFGAADFSRLLASHSRAGREGLCRHGEDGDCVTLSGALFHCREQRLDFWAGNPCAAKCEVFRP